MDIKLTVPTLNIAEALRQGYHEGVRYWCDKVRPFTGDLLLEPAEVTEEQRRNFWPIFEGSWLLHDSVSRNQMPLTTLSLKRGLEVIAFDEHRAWGQILSGHITPATGDTLIQCSVFGKVFYGRAVSDSGTVRAAHLCNTCRLVPPCECEARIARAQLPTVRP